MWANFGVYTVSRECNSKYDVGWMFLAFGDLVKFHVKKRIYPPHAYNTRVFQYIMGIFKDMI